MWGKRIKSWGQTGERKAVRQRDVELSLPPAPSWGHCLAAGDLLVWRCFALPLHPPLFTVAEAEPTEGRGVHLAGVERLVEQHLGPSSGTREPGPRLTGVVQAAQAGLARNWREKDSGGARWEILPECCLID